MILWLAPKKWALNWAEVRFCSDACRAHKRGTIDDELEQAIVALLAERGAGKTICPSEAARRVSGEPDVEARWRPLLEPARQAARRLVATGAIQILQDGVVVDGDTARGPIRLRALMGARTPALTR